MSNIRPQLTYFDIRGRAEPVRMLLAELEIEFDDVMVTPEEWQDLKPRMPFRRMPVFRHGDLVIPETFAIMNHLGRQHGLMGGDEAERIRCDVAIEAWRDYGNRVATLFGALSHPDAGRDAFVETELPERLSDLAAFYAQNPSDSGFWAGRTLTIADFAAYHSLDGVAARFADTLAPFDALQSFLTFFAARPKIRAYLDSPTRPAALFYGPSGKVYPTR